MMKRVAYNHFNEIVCPHCGSEYLHHQTVVAFCREEGTDGELTVSIENEQPWVSVCPGTAGAPENTRRSILRIAFWCENCRRRPHLLLLQYKGTTLIWSR